MATTLCTTSDVLTSANALLAEHAALISRIRTTQKQHRRSLHSIQPTPHELLGLPMIPSRSPSPEPEDESPPPSPQRNPLLRPDLSIIKKARATRYINYVPEEETIRNDYSQRYVDGGEWPQNWVLGAEPEHRFEECVHLCILRVLYPEALKIPEATTPLEVEEGIRKQPLTSPNLPPIFPTLFPAPD
jgi:mRNA (2'-O-methyladenosine-N6-)-methyltransferase